MKNLVVRGVLIAVVLALLVVGLERWHVTDEERVEAAWNDLVMAMEEEDPGRMRARLADDLEFAGPRRIGEGDKAQAMVALSGYWDQVDRTSIMTRKNEIQVQGHVATNLATTSVRFEWGDSMVVYRVRVKVAWTAAGEEWRARDIDVLEMNPGLF